MYDAVGALHELCDAVQLVTEALDIVQGVHNDDSIVVTMLRGQRTQETSLFALFVRVGVANVAIEVVVELITDNKDFPLLLLAKMSHNFLHDCRFARRRPSNDDDQRHINPQSRVFRNVRKKTADQQYFPSATSPFAQQQLELS